MFTTTAVFVFVCVGGCDWEGILRRTVSKLGCSGLLLVGGPKCVKIHHQLLFFPTQNVTNLGHLNATSCLDDTMMTQTHAHSKTSSGQMVIHLHVLFIGHSRCHFKGNCFDILRPNVASKIIKCPDHWLQL